MSSLKLCFVGRRISINFMNFTRHHSSYTLSPRRLLFCGLQTSIQTRDVEVSNLSVQKTLYAGENGFRKYGKSHSFNQNEKGKEVENPNEDPKPEKKLSLVKRYKKMLKEYWYVLIPVHMGTSAIWFGTFYYSATCGFDIVPLLEKMSVSDTIINPLRNSSLGYIAVASALYKLATPARYMVTLGVTTISIKYLKKHGLIKPVPSKDKIKSMIHNKLHPQDKKVKSD